MSTAKTVIETPVVLKFLRQHFDKRVASIECIHGGETAQAFSFYVGQKAFVIRVNTSLDGFAKDKYAYEHFSSEAIPIPKFIQLGRMQENVCFAITEKVAGNVLASFDEGTQEKILLHFVNVLMEIHKIDVAPQAKFGDWDSAGKASFDDWHHYILFIEDDEWFGWSTLFKDSFMEKQIFDKIYGRIVELIKYCPQRQYLIHGDCSFGNVLSDGRTITGVIDWGESKYGDFLYDIAFIDFWVPVYRFGEIFYDRYRKAGFDIRNYNARLMCYKLHCALQALCFWTISNQKEHYMRTRDKVLTLQRHF